MKVKNIESGLAWIGALVVLIGVSFAASNAFGAETAGEANASAAIGDIATVTVAEARNAIATSATEAAAAIAREAALGLEIRLTNHRSEFVADAQ